MKKILSISSLIIILVLTACGSATPVPQISVLDAQNTAIALAWTNVALTQAALPTSTPIPPTNTPEPTFTPFPTVPAPTFAPPPTSAAPTQGVDCNQPIPLPVKGTTTQVKFVNRSKGTAVLSFGMNEKNEYNECGIFSFTIPAGTAPVVQVLTGCYWAFAYINGAKTSTAKSPTSICIDASKTWGITITEEVIGFD